MTTGIAIFGIFNVKAINVVKQLVGQDAVITNRKLGIPHRLVRYGKPSTVYGNTDIRIPEDSVTANIEDPFIRDLTLMLHVVEGADKTILFFNNKTTVSLLAILLAKQVPKPVTVVVEDTILTDEQVMGLLRNANMPALKAQYERIFGRKRTYEKYDDDKLIRTPNGAKLRQYQQYMVDFACHTKRAGLFLDMGLGKTLATLATIFRLKDEGKLDITKPILIVAPKLVAIDTWAREADKWGYDVDVKVNVGLTPAKRKALLSTIVKPLTKLTFLTTNPEQLKAVYTFYDEQGIREPFQMIVVDELSMFKAFDGKQSLLLRQRSQNVEYFLGLTGTPMPNGLLDIWSQMVLIDPENKKTLGKDYWTYRGHFFEPDQVGHGRNEGKVFSWKIRKGQEHEVYRRMEKSVITMRSEGLIDLPSISYVDEYVTLPPKAMKLYRELAELTEKDMDNGNASLDLDQTTVTISNPAVRQGKLAQLASGAIYEDMSMLNDFESMYSTKVAYTTFHDRKLARLKEMVETATSPILLFVIFKSDMDRLGDYIEYEALAGNNAQIQDKITRWNKGEIPVMVVNPASVSHGLNIQEGGHTIIWLTPTWNNEQYRQANKRLHRPGQKNPVTVIHIKAVGTVDTEITNRVDEKEARQVHMMKHTEVRMKE